MDKLYAKVKAFLAGGTAGTAVAGLILWGLDTAGVDTPEAASVAITGIVANGIGLFNAYVRTETGPVRKPTTRRLAK